MHRSKRLLSRHARYKYTACSASSQASHFRARRYQRDLQALESHLHQLLRSGDEDITVGAAVVLTETEWLSEPPTGPELDEFLERVDEVVEAFPRDRELWMRVRAEARRAAQSAMLTGRAVP